MEGRGGQHEASGRALATSWLSRLLIELPMGSPTLVVRPQTLAHRSIHPLNQPYAFVDVLKLKNNYKATDTVCPQHVWKEKKGHYYENCLSAAASC